MPRANPWPELLSDAQIEEVAQQMLAALPPAATELLAQHGINPRDQIRFHVVAARCRATRERLEHTIKSAARALKVAQYRLKDIEAGQTGAIDPQVLTRYVAFLGLERWLARWGRHSPELAARLGMTPPDRRRRGRTAARAARGTRAVLQFRVELQEIVPPVYRRIQVPSRYTFWDLHVAIQDAMGWTDSHLHEFELRHPVTGQHVRIGIPDDDFPDERPTRPCWTTPIAPYFEAPGTTAQYLYDFGDDWHHSIVIEGTQTPQPRSHYPRCLDGAHACPPEDVGGPHGYEEFVAVVADTDHEEHDAMLEWAGGAFDPARFSAEEVRFDDPRVRWRIAFGPE